MFNIKEENIKATLAGLAIGDALGVPVEFRTRDELAVVPVKTMTGYGTWNQPPGTWSDDSSLAFCLAESLCKKYDVNDIANNFIQWMTQGFWGAHHKVFDVGGATRMAVNRLIKGVSPQLSGGMFEEDNGNGSLMRIMPLLFSIADLPVQERFLKIKEVSSITHAHFRSVFACFIYMEFARNLLMGKNKSVAYADMQTTVNDLVQKEKFHEDEIKLFDRLLKKDISKEPENEIGSSGYVVDTLEASFWCSMTTDYFNDAVLKAVNLGRDTDTTGCVTGGLAGLLYGFDEIPPSWIETIARKNDIMELAEKLFSAVSKNI